MWRTIASTPPSRARGGLTSYGRISWRRRLASSIAIATELGSARTTRTTTPPSTIRNEAGRRARPLPVHDLRRGWSGSHPERRGCRPRAVRRRRVAAPAQATRATGAASATPPTASRPTTRPTHDRHGSSCRVAASTGAWRRHSARATLIGIALGRGRCGRRRRRRRRRWPSGAAVGRRSRGRRLAAAVGARGRGGRRASPSGRGVGLGGRPGGRPRSGLRRRLRRRRRVRR